ncbi:MAG: hypothetical protein ABJB97_09030 [Acidobacteriota bacterium]
MITQPLTNNLSHETTSALRSKSVKQRASSLLPWAFMIMFIGVVIGVIGKLVMHAEIVTAVGVLISIAGMFLTAYPYLLPSRRQSYDSSSPSQPQVPTQSQPAKSLTEAGNLGYVDSIVERTTDLLEHSPAIRPREKADSVTLP